MRGLQRLRQRCGKCFNGDGIDDPTTATKVFWEKPKDAPSYPKGQCRVHITHYQIRQCDDKYYIEDRLKAAYKFEIGHMNKTDATKPVDVFSALPSVLVIRAAKPGSLDNPDGAPLQFAYGSDTCLVTMRGVNLVVVRMGTGRAIVVSLARVQGLRTRCPTIGDTVFLGAYRRTLPALITLHLFSLSLGHEEGAPLQYMRSGAENELSRMVSL
ncbi:MAG: hypothetical protein Q9192_005380 [Flavoplaca navasiana]